MQAHDIHVALPRAGNDEAVHVVFADQVSVARVVIRIHLCEQDVITRLNGGLFHAKDHSGKKSIRMGLFGGLAKHQT